MAASRASASGGWTATSVYTLGFLTLISTFNYLDRSILGLVLPLIKAEMQVSDTVLGLVSGFVFVLFYSILGVPIAWAADRYSRRNIIAIGLAFWSAMTAMTGFVANIVQLAVLRLMMGAGEAACLAPSQSMISDLFSAARRPLAVAIFGTAFGISGVVFTPALGLVIEHWGWRGAFVAAGLPGMLLALIFILTVREPERGAQEAVKAPPTRVPFAEMVRTMASVRTYLFILAGASFMGANVWAGGSWSAAFVNRVHGLSVSDIAYITGPVRGILGMAGVLFAGLLANWLGQRNPRWRMLVPGLLCLAVVPSEALFLLADADALWIAGLGLTSFFTIAHQAPIFAAILSVAPVRMRATAVAAAILFTGIMGQVLGPLIVGILNDWLQPSLGDIAIRYSMTIIILTALIGGIFFLLGARSFEADARRASGEAGKEAP